MKTLNREQKVRLFNKTMGGYDMFDETEIVKRRVALMEEEWGELKEALYLYLLGETSREHVLKEMCDVQYILSGTADALGFTDVFEPAFNRVHDNNMTKFKEGVKFNGQGKVVKPMEFEEVQLGDLV